MTNIISSTEWLNFIWTLHNKVRNGKGVKLTGLGALNEINNFLLILFLSRKLKDYDLDDTCSLKYMYDKFCSPEAEQKEKKLKDPNYNNYKKLHEHYCDPTNDDCVLLQLINNDIIKKYLKNDVTVICSLCDNNETGRTILDIFKYMYEHFQNIAKNNGLEDINELSIDDFGFDAFGNAYEKFKQQSCEDSGKTTGQHFTPVIAKEYIINELKIKDTEIFYEPCAGSGGFIHTSMKYIKNNNGDYIKFVKNLFANECNGEIYKPLSINMLIHDIPIDNINKQDSLDMNWCLKYQNKFDVIATNPPFGQGDKTEKNEYWGPLVSGKNVIKDAMAQFIMHMYQSLKDGGRCGTVSDRGIISNGTDGKNSWENKLRKFLLENTNLYKIVLLPPGTFSYTKFATCMLFFTKGSKTEKVEFRDLSFNEINIDGQKTKVINEDKLLGVIDIKTIKEKNYSLKPDDYFKEEVVIKEEDKDKWVKLGDIVKFNIGGTPSRKEAKYYEGNNLWISVSELNNTIINDTKEKITDLGIKESSVKLIKKGSILMSFKLSIGKMGIAGKDMYCNEAIMFFKHDNDITNKYLYYYLSLNNLSKYASGQIGIGSLNKTSLYNITLPNLSIDHQEDIVKFLDEQFENYNINNLKKDVPIFKLLIAKQYEMAAELLHVVYRQMAAELEVKNIEKDMKAIFNLNINKLEDCETKKLGDICEIKNYKPIKIEKSNNTGKYPFYNCSILGHLWSDEYQYEDDVLLINKVNGSGKCRIYHNNGKFSIAANMLIFKTSNNKFFEKLLNYNTKIISKKFKGGDKKALNLEDFKNIIFPIPSLEKQKEIVNKIEKFENYKLQYIDHANMIKEELDNYIKYINDNEIDENINYNNIINDNESEVDLEIEIEDSISESSE
jgi:type I restriction-modification system DNA methylase subunit